MPDVRSGLGSVCAMRIVLIAMSNPISPRRPLDRPTIYRIAAAADCDPRTVARALRGEPVRGRVAERLSATLRGLGIQLSHTLQPRSREVTK